MSDRFQEIEVLRSIAIVFIIFAHMDSFTSSSILASLDGTFAVLGLSIFFFISGFLMQRNNKFTTSKSLYSFIKKRAKKIYPLYWLSIITIYFMNMADINTLYSNDITANKFLLLVNVLGFQGLFPENYSLSIWWFVGVILLYYALFSIILYYSKNIGHLVIYSFLSTFPLLFMRNELSLINLNVFGFYSVFIAGILSATVENLQSLKTATLSYFTLLFAFLFLSYFGFNTNNLANIEHDVLFMMLFFVFSIYKIKFSIGRTIKLPAFMKKLADSSYCIYLFHIQILTVLELIINSFISLNTHSLYYKDTLTIFLGIPLTIYLGYYIAELFNKYSKKILF